MRFQSIAARTALAALVLAILAGAGAVAGVRLGLLTDNAGTVFMVPAVGLGLAALLMALLWHSPPRRTAKQPWYRWRERVSLSDFSVHACWAALTSSRGSMRTTFFTAYASPRAPVFFLADP